MSMDGGLGIKSNGRPLSAYIAQCGHLKSSGHYCVIPATPFSNEVATL